MQIQLLCYFCGVLVYDPPFLWLLLLFILNNIHVVKWTNTVQPHIVEQCMVLLDYKGESVSCGNVDYYVCWSKFV